MEGPGRFSGLCAVACELKMRKPWDSWEAPAKLAATVVMESESCGSLTGHLKPWGWLESSLALFVALKPVASIVLSLSLFSFYNHILYLKLLK